MSLTAKERLDAAMKRFPIDGAFVLIPLLRQFASEIDALHTLEVPASAVPVGWGEPVRYLTDDRDNAARYELVIQQGGNGDWYVSVLPEGHVIGPAVRLCTSGGASSKVPGLTLAISHAYRALRGELVNPAPPASPATVSVPREPTDAMLKAALAYDVYRYGVGQYMGIYRAMLAAAPKEPK